MRKRKAVLNRNECVACGCCMKVCPRGAISIPNGTNAIIDEKLCVGCGRCVKECPASIMSVEVSEIEDKKAMV